MPRQAELKNVSNQRVRVVAGILQDASGRILIADRTRSRSLKDHWEFPGGKVNTGESSQAALRRELAEELGIEIAGATQFLYAEHDYSHMSVAIQFFLVADWKGTPDGREGQRIRWVDRTSLDPDLLLPADAPVIEALRSL
jgi:8-oxo-dGTP diphosphatase